MTLMVRDEADIVSSMLDHHLAQGVDVIIVTDNGSVDGTAELLEGYAARGLIDLRHDPVQRKQQSSVVTAMARDAYTVHGADWVINADADEFFLPVDRSLTLHEAFEGIPKSIEAFLVPVTNLTGSAARRGSGVQRLHYRDLRSDAELAAAGLRAHPTADAVHIGVPDIDVIQGNHFVSLASKGVPDEAFALEVLHLPWRSYEQFRNKVEVSGRAYESNPELTPSPNHHGMRDYARLKAGLLQHHYLLRHPDEAELAAGLEAGRYAEERVLADTVVSAVEDEGFSPEEQAEFDTVAPALREAESRFGLLQLRYEALEAESAATIADLHAEIDAAKSRIAEVEATVAERDARVLQLEQLDTLTQAHVTSLETRVGELSERWEVRVSNRVRRGGRRAR
ncbi:glycosyltransferase family 2 protein [Herbiconiux liukaitaii]|uniref:glycosyltransferase family 2 protein n=1 Tax=Herbiconiux liukaitaii TaxID=3342799 RepID=UPI0035B962D0